MKIDVHKLLSITILLCIFAASSVFAASGHSDQQQMRDCLSKQDWQGALSALKQLIPQSPKDAAMLIIDDENEKLWGPKVSEAIEVLKSVSESAPKDAAGLQIRVCLLDCYKYFKSWDLAYPLVDTIATDFPNDKVIYHNLKGICYYYQNKHAEALSEIKAAADLYNGTQDDKELIGYVLASYPYDDSNRILRIAYTMIRYLPDCSDKQRASIYRWAWTMCLDSNCISEANEIAAKAYSSWDKIKDRNDPEIMSVMIHAYLDAKAYDKAIPLCKEIVAKKPEIAVDALTVMAECMHAMGKDQEALDYQADYYKQHPELKEEKDWTYTRTIFYTSQDKATTISLLEKFLIDYPDTSHKFELQNLLYYAYKAGLKTSKEIKVLQEMIKTCPDDKKAGISTKLAEVYSFVNTAKADTLLNQLIQDNPDHYLVPEWKVLLANCKFTNGDISTARDEYKAIYEQYPNNQYGYKAHISYAHCCLCQGNKAEGKAALEEIVSKCPDKKSVADAKERLSLLKS